MHATAGSAPTRPSTFGQVEDFLPQRSSCACPRALKGSLMLLPTPSCRRGTAACALYSRARAQLLRPCLLSFPRWLRTQDSQFKAQHHYYRKVQVSNPPGYVLDPPARRQQRCLDQFHRRLRRGHHWLPGNWEMYELHISESGPHTEREIHARG